MRPVHVAALGLLLALVAPAGAAARVGVTQHAINVTLLHEQTFERQRARAQADAQIVRARARACLDEFRAAPQSARRDLLGSCFNAVSGALWRVARAHLRTSVSVAESVYRAGIEDPCTVVEAWKAGGFAPSAAPDDVLELSRLGRSAARRAVSGAPLALRRLLRAQGKHAARRALAAFERGADEADAKVIRPGDAVVAAPSA